jgi:hypothetical protein
MDSALLKAAFDAALPYERYLATDPGKAAPWRAVKSELTAPQRALLGSFTRRMPVLVLSGVWCGDCAQQGPMLEAIARGTPCVDMRRAPRAHGDLDGRGLRVRLAAR